MKGITEERLRDISRDYPNVYVSALVGICTEINPWQPIESAPKDRRLLLATNKGPTSGSQWVGWANADWPWPHTHYCELPEDPK